LLSFALFLSGILGHQQDACFAKYGRSHWAEALFYLHALALPLFGFGAPRMASEMRAVSTIEGGEGVQIKLSSTAIGRLIQSTPILDYKRPVRLQLALSIPAFYLPLLLNAVTQLLCVAGVNRLTSRVTSLTVTLVLVVRKAVSLAISVAFFNKEGGKGRSGVLLWTGAALVLAGTVGYTIGSRNGQKKQKQEKLE
jgi:UDP-xylose/UDP-N-acetylglucosamine transporter B4